MTEAAKPEKSKGETKLEKVIELNASVDEVWKALTDSKELANWFPLEARVTPGKGGKVFLSWGPDCEGESEILEWEPGKRLSGKDPFSLIEWTLEARGGKTILRLVQTGFLSGEDWSNEWFESTSYGWGFMLASLKWLLERHKGEVRKVAWPRQKTSLSREEAYARLLKPGNFFSGDLAAVLREGQKYSLQTFSEGTFSGQVEFVRPLRGFCVTVEELNDALLWFTIEGAPGQIEVQVWLSAFGVAQTEVDKFGAMWGEQLKRVFAS